MASIAARVSLRSLTVPVRQLAFAWAIGSVIMGTVALLFLAFPMAPYVAPTPAGGSLPYSSPLPANLATRTLVPPLAGLPLLALLAVLALGVLLFVALYVLAWHTHEASWLPDNVRGWVLWALLTGVAGLIGWLFAASVTFGAGFSPLAQGVLAYTAGGLPFALAAALLQPSWLVNLASVVVCAALIAAGFALVAAQASYEPNALILSVDYVRYLLGGVPPGRWPGPVPGGPIITY